MAPELFEIDLTDGPALALHERASGNVAERYPWASLEPSRYPPLLVERARHSWTLRALNEFGSATVMGQLVQVMGEARVPLDLWSLAARFPAEEVHHVELCARMAMALGGGARLAYDPASFAVAFDPSLTFLQRASELLVRVCCVGETLSFALLSGCLRATSHPLTRAVLTTLVQEEALHGRLGFLYLEWIAPELGAAEKERLGRVAREALDAQAPLWERLRSTTKDGVTREGFLLEHVTDLGWMESQDYIAVSRETAETQVRAPLLRHGIRVP
ncbi:diiron oxygenase [Corallococcus sp. Z5C101001]|uniref:diiron oxygenase n=1 Tax=Corallococcus sp. Z5C101001 TaxID=2596829 RepID=UPI00117E187E|nr:diiron oxygenase [Corallococcus sp. Z5C101001]TSC25216.1 diiron oxygenase [Corallococcus sp. Z5C101001]